MAKDQSINLNDLELKDQMIINQIIRSYLEKIGSVYPGEWSYTFLDNQKISYDLILNLRD